VVCSTQNCSGLLLWNGPSFGNSITWGSNVILIGLGAIPSCITILLWIHKFKDTGSVSNSPHGAPSNMCTEENGHRASVSFQHCPICPAQQHSRILGTSTRSFGWNLQDEGCTHTRYRQTYSFFLMIKRVRIFVTPNWVLWMKTAMFLTLF
jgi:hypothetical protein